MALQNLGLHIAVTSRGVDVTQVYSGETPKRDVCFYQTVEDSLELKFYREEKGAPYDLATEVLTVGELRGLLKDRRQKAAADAEQAKALELPTRTDPAPLPIHGQMDDGLGLTSGPPDGYRAQPRESGTTPVTPSTEPIRIGPSSSNPDPEF